MKGVVRVTHVNGEALPGTLLALGYHLPVQHPGVGEVGEEVAVRPAHVQLTVGVVHGGDVGSLGSCGGQREREIDGKR